MKGQTVKNKGKRSLCCAVRHHSKPDEQADLRAVFYHLKYLAKIKANKEDFNGGRILAKQTKDALKPSNLLAQLLQINKLYNNLADRGKK